MRRDHLFIIISEPSVVLLLYSFLQTTAYHHHHSSAKKRGGVVRTKQKQLPLQYGRMTREKRRQYQAKGESIKTRGLDDISAVVLLRR